MVRILLSVALILGITAATAGAALAWPGALEDAPALTGDSPAGYYIWHDDEGVHLRTHGPGAEHFFVARVRTDGIFTDVDAVRLESRDRFAVLDGGRTLVFRVRTYDATDGMNFRVRGGARLRFNLQLNGDLIDTESIYLGAAGKHPEHNPFTLHR